MDTGAGTHDFEWQKSCWFEDDGAPLHGQRMAAVESENSCGLSESDVFSLGLTSLPASQPQQQPPWSAFAHSAQLEPWPCGPGGGGRCGEPSLLEEALTSCGLQSLLPQLSECSAAAYKGMTSMAAGGRCVALRPFAGAVPDALISLPDMTALGAWPSSSFSSLQSCAVGAQVELGYSALPPREHSSFEEVLDSTALAYRPSSSLSAATEACMPSMMMAALVHSEAPLPLPRARRVNAVPPLLDAHHAEMLNAQDATVKPEMADVAPASKRPRVCRVKIEVTAHQQDVVPKQEGAAAYAPPAEPRRRRAAVATPALFKGVVGEGGPGADSDDGGDADAGSSEDGDDGYDARAVRRVRRGSVADGAGTGLGSGAERLRSCAALGLELPIAGSAVAGVARRACLQRYRAKKARRLFTHTVRYAARKANADRRPRVKGRFVKVSELAAHLEALR